MTGKAAKVSLIVPVYNVEAYLGKCLESCSAQTLNDLEIICVDDGSTDNSGKILDEYAKEESRAVVIHKENGGLSSARNAGIRAASGEWIMFLDSDDYLEPNACERIWWEGQQEYTEIIIFGSDFFPKYPMPENAQWLRSVLYTRTQRFNRFEMDTLLYVPGAKPFVWRQAFLSKFLKSHSLQFEDDFRYAEDIIFQFKAFPRAKRISFIADSLYRYRISRNSSLMQKANANPEKKLQWHIDAVEHITSDWDKLGLLEEHGEKLLGWALRYTVLDTNAVLNKEQAAQLLDIFREHDLAKYGKELPSEERAIWKKLQRI